MTSNPEYFHTYNEFKTPCTVSGISEGQLLAYGSGTIVLQSLNDNESQHAINNVWYVPYLTESFISLNATIDSNLSLQVDDNGNLMLKSNVPGSNFHIRTSRINRMTTITNVKAIEYTFTAHAAAALITNTNSTIDTNDDAARLWHERLGHIGAERLKRLGIIWKPGSCRECIMGKQTREPFRPNPSRSLIKLHRIYSDLCGPITPPSYGNARYVITFTDECSRYCWAYTINDKHASTIVDILKQWIPLVQNQASTTIKFMFTDRGNEYLGKADVTPYLRSMGIQHEQTAASSSKSNGIAERMNRTIFDIVRPMMLTANAPTPFWAEAVDTALKIRNRLPTKPLNNVSPHEAWFNESPNVDKLRQFGCIAYALDLRIPRGNKADPRSTECCFLGYESVERHIYRLWDPERNHLIISRNVEFMESRYLPRERFADIPYRDTPLFIPDNTVVEESREPREIQNYDQPRIYRPEYIPSHQHGPEPQRRPYLIPPPNYQPTDDENSSDDEDSDPDDTNPIQRKNEDTSPTQSDGEHLLLPVEHQPDIATIQPQVQEPIRRSERTRKLSRKARDAANLAVFGPHPINTNDTIEPDTFDEAMSLPEAQLWLKACQEEIESLNRHKTFRLCNRPPGRKIVGTKWVFKIKDPEGKNPRYKARLVAQGYSQVEGLDYNETRASVVKITSIKIILSLAARLQMLVHQFDVETAYLNGHLTTAIYAEQPPGFVVNGFKDCVLLLQKALYGLKQAGYEWLQELRRSMYEIGYRQCEEDENIFISHDNRVIVAVYVDDILMIAHEEHRINELANEISKFFTIRFLGPVKRFLSLDIYRPDPRGDIYISQGTYIRRILQRFDMQDANPVKTPTLSSVKLHKRKDDEDAADAELFRQIVGSCMHASVYIRTDIAYIVNKLSQYYSDPSIYHLQAAKHVLRYLKGCPDLGILFRAGSEEIPKLFADASYATDADDSKSTSGYVAMYNGGVISHASQKQKNVALSSMEAEYSALSEGCREAIFINKLLSALNLTSTSIIPVFSDSASSLSHVKNNVKHSRTKHFIIREDYVKSTHHDGLVDLQHIPSEHQAADILTKPLGTIKHQLGLDLLQMVDVPSD